LRERWIKFWDLKSTTGTFEEEETTKLFDLFPHADKKLHSSTSNVWTDPFDNNSWGTIMGEEIKEDRDLEEVEWDDLAVRFERYCWREEEDETEVWAERMVTLKSKDFHSRPPDPEDELRSSSKSSHTPNSLGVDKVTTGGDNNSREGTETVRLWETVNGQLEQPKSVLEVHRAFNTPLFRNNTSPALSADAGDNSKDLSSAHTQRTPSNSMGEEDGEREDFEKLNNFEQLFASSDFTKPPSLVEPTNVTKILLPYEEKVAFFIKGPGTGSSDTFTSNSEPEENQIS
jgi:hypothetical protein